MNTVRPKLVRGFDDLDREWLRSRSDVKWHRPGPGVPPAWVADMDFLLPPPVATALHETVDRGALGYPDWPHGTPLRAAFAERMAARYGWDAPAARVREQTDLIQSLQLLLHLATASGDAVAVQTPNYPPFLATLRTMNRRAVPVPMVDTDDGWRMDFAALADGVARRGCEVLLLVNPHNPTGRVLTREELTDLAAIARRHDLLIISDEIHAELTYLSWIDTRELRLDGPVDHVLREGGVLLDGGEPFGPGAEDYLRLNFATSHDVLEDIFDGVTKATHSP